MDFLDKDSMEALKIIAESKEGCCLGVYKKNIKYTHKLTESICEFLLNRKYIEEKLIFSDYGSHNQIIYRITSEGTSYLKKWEETVEDNRLKKEEAKKATRSNNIRALVTIIISLAGLVLSIYNACQANIVKFEESVMISNVYEEDYYFDGETLSKEINFIISNNSQVAISFTKITVTRGGKIEKVHYNDNSYHLPINFSSNNSLKQSVYIVKDLEKFQIDLITNEFGINCYINTFELDMFLEEDGVNVYKNTIIKARPSLEIVLITSKNNQFVYQSRGGASAKF